MNHKVEDYLFSKLFLLAGKMSKSEFKKITKHYKWKFNYQKVHIVGTNAKGSIANFLNDELILQNYQVGLFSSPHLFSPYERIKINDHLIDFEKIVKYTSDFQSQFPEINFGFFDLFFLCALRWFEEYQVNLAIFEAGIGAKKDVVNYLNYDLTIFGTINLDHQDILGQTLKAIAQDKACAIKTNNQVYLMDLIDSKIQPIFQNRAQKFNANLKIIPVDPTDFYQTNKSYVQAILKDYFKIENFQSGFHLPAGRMKKITINKYDCLADVAHNLEGIQAVIAYLKKHQINYQQVVVSLSSDKDHQQILKLLAEHFQLVLIYQNHGRKPLMINDYLQDYYGGKIYNLSSWLKKLDQATLFIGSFYFISELLKEVKNGNKNNFKF